MGTIITDLKNTFQRGNIHIRFIYINAGCFIITTLIKVLLQLFNRANETLFQWGELPASINRFISQPCV